MMSDEDKAYVYTLTDPRTDEIRYVGATVNPQQRLSSIMSNPHSKRITRWVNDLKSAGKRPEMNIVKETTKENVEEEERKLIAEHRKKYALLNSSQVQPYSHCEEDTSRPTQASISVFPETKNKVCERRNADERYDKVIRRLLEQTKWAAETE